MQVPPLARSALDPDHASRTRAGAVEAAMADPRARVVLVAGDRSPVADGRLVRLAPAQVDAAWPALAAPSLLGRERAGDLAGAAVLCLQLAEPVVVDGADWQPLRAVGAALDDEDAGILVQAVALGAWQRESAHSPVTGEPAALEAAGWVRREPDGTQHFPRTDPAVIVAIHDAADERILLGHNAAWPTDRYSLIAGFVEPGESLEAAVVREVAEETGLTVERPRYLASQPWPFPRSLMLGFDAIAPEPDDLRPDGVEILDLRWCTREELRAGAVQLPGPASIASWIIERWLDAPRSPR